MWSAYLVSSNWCAKLTIWPSLSHHVYKSLYNGTCQTPSRPKEDQSSATPFQVSLPSQFHAYALCITKSFNMNSPLLVKTFWGRKRFYPPWNTIVNHHNSRDKISTVLGLSDKKSDLFTENLSQTGVSTKHIKGCTTIRVFIVSVSGAVLSL